MSFAQMVGDQREDYIFLKASVPVGSESRKYVKKSIKRTVEDPVLDNLYRDKKSFSDRPGEMVFLPVEELAGKYDGQFPPGVDAAFLESAAVVNQDADGEWGADAYLPLLSGSRYGISMSLLSELADLITEEIEREYYDTYGGQTVSAVAPSGLNPDVRLSSPWGRL